MKNIENAIEVYHVTKVFKVVYDKAQSFKEKFIHFGKRKQELHKVLDDVSLEIKKGETVALIGTNGCGKSTLLKMMTKILYPNKGTIEVNGKLTSLLELGAGFHPDFTGRENIYFNASIFGLTREQIENRVEDIIEFSELGEFIDNPIRTYSSGMYMRLAFSIAINVDAEILLIDEILAVGDQHFQDKCYAKLHELSDSNKTIVIVSHSLDVVKTLCERAVWIYKGKIKKDGDPIEVIDSYLNQVNEDYIDSIKTRMSSGDYKLRGLCYIDEPVDGSVYASFEKNVIGKGWSMCEDPESIVKCFIDGNEVEGLIRVKRPDVLRVYSNQYGGYLSNPKPGWEVPLLVSKMKEGKHEFKIIVYDSCGNEITSKNTVFFVKEEEE